MTTYALARDLIAAGTSRKELAQQLRHHDLHHVRRGAYREPGELTIEQQHRLLVESTLAMGDGRSVASFGSAAVLHGLPVFGPAISKVHLTRNRSAGGRKGSVVYQHVAELGRADVCDIDGLPVTSLARTFVDLARTLSVGQAVATGDQALRAGMELSAVGDQLVSARGRRGIQRARHAATLLDGLSESPGESLSRVLMLSAGLPRPQLQVELLDGRGRFVARPDFFWPDHGVAGEFDGKTKYLKLLGPGETTADVVLREKMREERMRELGLIVIRWIWDELYESEELLARIASALRHGTPYAGRTRERVSSIPG